MHAEVTTSTSLPHDYEGYDVCIFVDYPHVLPTELTHADQTKYIFIFFKNAEIAETYTTYAYDNHLKNFKTILIESEKQFYVKDIETLLWFAFSRTEDLFLHIYHPDSKPFPKKKKKKSFSFPRKISLSTFQNPKTLIVSGLLFILITHFLFVPTLLLASFFHYQAGTQLMKGDIKAAEEILPHADRQLALTNSLYAFPKKTFHLFFVGLYMDDMIRMNSSANAIIHSLIRLQKNGTELAAFMSVSDKTDDEIERMYEQKESLFKDIQIVHTEIDFIKNKIPSFQKTQVLKARAEEASHWLSILSSWEPYLDTLFAKGEEKKYLLLFANNMELRPGGGFIGSFAILRLKDYSIQELKVYDVYDADGQLTEQIDPPAPIVKYLDQTHWYLRDSAFTPDFVDNFRQAETFIEKEIGETDFDGGILLTTTAVQHLLEATNGLYIPDYKETITKDNFYIKTQLYAEEDFFPGSTQKKRFLGSVLNQILIGLPDASLSKLIQMAEKSLDEKQLVLYSRNGKLQGFLEENYWSGRLLKPKCGQDEAANCILDFVYVLDANLGVNKANYYVQRPMALKVSLEESGKITNDLTITYRNDSYSDVFPGGIYKNYVQILLPPNSQISAVTIDEKQTKEYDETNFNYKTIGLYLEVPPQSTRTVTLTYTLPISVIKGAGVYQLIFQKQVGSPNLDFNLDFGFPESVIIHNKNLSPLVKDHEIHYNTSISSDQIFLIEFSKN
jgi:hypothetical protein